FLSALNNQDGVHFVAGTDFEIVLTDGTKLTIDLDGGDTTLGHVFTKINAAATAAHVANVTGQPDRFTVTFNTDRTGIVLTDSKSTKDAQGNYQLLQVNALHSSTAAADLGILGTGKRAQPGGQNIDADGQGSGSVLEGDLIADISSDILVTKRN